ncbi:hypothetical protein EWM64_g1725 [Hericium alpestre]|uniref:Peptidase M24 domain-containing protein n=1 Tax=Hericium alpestre TaxID=135208 RepID=A0A4Z0A5G4_9AGAM|nr:hypothetical protein EWM64_g1725 [Hericium alpestre]
MKYSAVSQADQDRVEEEERRLQWIPSFRKPLFYLSLVCLWIVVFFAPLLAEHYDFITAKSHASIPSYSHLATHCASVSSIPASEFQQRQQTLAEMLHALNASAYIAEPGASALYYGNISGSAWHLSERPLLLLVTPEIARPSEGAAEVRPKISVLTPAFEATRAKLLPVPAEQVSYPEWPEDVNPYEVAVSAISSLVPEGKIYVDGAIRHFIVDGLQKAAPKARVLNAPVEIRELRERKSQRELEIMKCANEVTVLAIRAVRARLFEGIRESEASGYMHDALAAAGLQDLFYLVLFGENAALPHGSGTDRILGKHDFVLIDCGGSLHSYQSDVTRTFLLDDSSVNDEKMALWNTIKAAQAYALQTARAGVLTRVVDQAARDVISEGANVQYFTHRLGHGIGLEGHESPYLVGGSNDIIQIGHTFSDEPGIYIEGKVGVRLEDCFYINNDGEAVYLTQGVGGPARNPWSP